MKQPAGGDHREPLRALARDAREVLAHDRGLVAEPDIAQSDEHGVDDRRRGVARLLAGLSLLTDDEVREIAHFRVHAGELRVPDTLDCNVLEDVLQIEQKPPPLRPIDLGREGGGEDRAHLRLGQLALLSVEAMERLMVGPPDEGEVGAPGHLVGRLGNDDRRGDRLRRETRKRAHVAGPPAEATGHDAPAKLAAHREAGAARLDRDHPVEPHDGQHGRGVRLTHPRTGHHQVSHNFLSHGAIVALSYAQGTMPCTH